MYIDEKQHIDTTPWKPKHILYVLIIGSVINLLFYLTIKKASFFFPDIVQFFHDGKGYGITMFLAYLIQLFSFLAPMYIIGKKLGVSSWKETLGFHHIERKKIILAVLLAQLTTIFTFSLLSFSMWIAHVREIPGFSGEQDSLSTFFGNSGLSYLLAFIAVSVLAPLAEEIFFRAMIQKTCKKYLPAALGVICSALIFSLSHFEFQVAVPLFIMGIILGTLFEKTESLIPGIIFHGINNSLFIILEIWK